MYLNSLTDLELENVSPSDLTAQLMGIRKSSVECLDGRLRARAVRKMKNPARVYRDSESPWMSEDYRMSIFDAVGFAMAYFHLEKQRSKNRRVQDLT